MSVGINSSASSSAMKPKTPRSTIRENIASRKADAAVEASAPTSRRGGLFSCLCGGGGGVVAKTDPRLIKKVHNLWGSIKEKEDGEVERLKCWEIILADEALIELIGKGDSAKGKARLLAMKAVRALDQVREDGRICEEEFCRLYDGGVLASADQFVHTDEDDPLRVKVLALGEAA